eukprot:CAMPEP_0119301070 /NCGR_PEP_ID=MMETSP1333-20130426/2916_1 /TAXON_ID=418940 /ORGANISM="Scyphosphaera apsteinii, Strain RCC1455" /LENGTH=400 /DNA_ID=CAMNT_0007303043 /DNA_START=119 /DNA_END=1321 /DNA_ORIENTATION=-
MDKWREKVASLHSNALNTLDSAKQRVAVATSGVDTSKLKESALARTTQFKAAAGCAMTFLPASLRADVPAADAEGGVASDNEQSRLVDGDDAEHDDDVRSQSDAGSSIRADATTFGDRLGRIGFSTLTTLNNKISIAKNVGAHGVEGLMSATTLGTDKLRAASQAGKEAVQASKEKCSAAVQASKEKCSAAVQASKEKCSAAVLASKEKCSAAVDTASMVSGISMARNEKRAETLVGRICYCCPTLSYKQRLIGCFSCVAMGFLLSLLSFSSFTRLLLGNPAPFAFKYTIGNLLSLGATTFLVGPARQCRDMLSPQRRFISLLYLGTLVGTLVSVFLLKIAILSLLFILLQFAALTWYMLSYIPYGHTLAKKLGFKVLKRAGVALPQSHKATPINPAAGD